MKIVIRQIKILLAIFLSIFVVSLLLSTSASPSSPFTYNIKRLQEKTKLALISNQSKNLEYQLILLENRLTDLKTILSQREHSYILTSSLRYSTTAGQITEHVIKNNMQNETPKILDIFSKHKQTVEILIESYPKDLDGEWKFLQDDINYLTIYSDMLNQNK